MILTNQLQIIPLSLHQFNLLLEKNDEIVPKLNLAPSYEFWDESTWKTMKAQYQLALENPEYSIWFTNWQIILKSENRSIGSANFKNIPDQNGVTEIGYDINPKFHNQGYMSEALLGICKWALQQDNVVQVIAETAKENIASQKVLQKCGFINYLEDETSFLWRIDSL